tara:strand:+ start:657 stop:1187 length:531 start_codon:yes stop_codon:yes gene_type:complete
MLVKDKLILEDKGSVLVDMSNINLDKHCLVNNGSSSFNSSYNFDSFKSFTPILDKFKLMAGDGFNVTDFWFNIYQKGGYVKPHNHITLNDDLKHAEHKVGAYYFKKPKNSGNLVINDEEHEIEEDDLILFRNSDIHYSTPNNTNSERIVFSINLMKGVKHNYREGADNEVVVECHI